MYFPLRPYLTQILIRFDTPIILNPWRFWRHHQLQNQLQQLEICWQIDLVQQLERCWEQDWRFEEPFYHFFQD